MRPLALELLKVGMGLVLVFGILEMAKFVVLAAGLGYIIAIFISPVLIPIFVAGTALVVIYGYAAVYLAWRALKSPRKLSVGDATSLSQVALVNSGMSALFLDFFLAVANVIVATSLYIYAKEKIRSFN